MRFELSSAAIPVLDAAPEERCRNRSEDPILREFSNLQATSYDHSVRVGKRVPKAAAPRCA